MKELLEKYPFLVYRNAFSDEKCFDEKKDLEINYYKELDGYGWEGIWKKYLEKLLNSMIINGVKKQKNISIYRSKREIWSVKNLYFFYRYRRKP